MKGFVPTPAATVDVMVASLFGDVMPRATDRVLDPGCGTGAFLDGVLRWCAERDAICPQLVGVESDPKHVEVLRQKYSGCANIEIQHRDYLSESCSQFEYIIANPPYVPITKLDEDERTRYRNRYQTAQRRFDLYLLFFEQALRDLSPGGRLVFITPEKFLYVDSASVLRALLARRHVESIRLVDEETFGSLVTYPTITVVRGAPPGVTAFYSRAKSLTRVLLPPGMESWLPVLMGSGQQQSEPVLADVCSRISCGIATGADSVFVLPERELKENLQPFSYPTVAGRELKLGDTSVRSDKRMLLPYDRRGRLLEESELGELGTYLRQPAVKARLLERTCVERKPWYAFHETPHLPQLLRPKILCKDICEHPVFVPDQTGELVPRHSVYFIVPADPSTLGEILDHLNSDASTRWLRENCQRAAKGYLRLQSRVLQRLPIPPALLERCSTGQTPPLNRNDMKQLSLALIAS